MQTYILLFVSFLHTFAVIIGFLYGNINFHYLRQNKLPMESFHEKSEEAQELIFTHFTSQEHQEKVTLQETQSIQKNLKCFEFSFGRTNNFKYTMTNPKKHTD